MTKLDFLYDLRDALKTLPKEDVERYIDYYSEMIDDRIDDGMSEEDAVAALGGIEDIAVKILGDMPPRDQTEENKEHKEHEEAEMPEKLDAAPRQKGSLSALAMLLIIFGAPLWLPLLVSVCSVIIALVAVLFSVVISIYSVPLSLAVIAFAFIVWAVYAFIAESAMYGLLFVGGAFLMAGLAILTLLLSNLISKFLWSLLKTVFGWIKRIVKRR